MSHYCRQKFCLRRASHFDCVKMINSSIWLNSIFMFELRMAGGRGALVCFDCFLNIGWSAWPALRAPMYRHKYHKTNCYSFVRSVDLMKLKFMFDKLLYFFSIVIVLGPEIVSQMSQASSCKKHFISFHFQNVYHMMIFDDIACLKWPLVRVCAADPGELPARKTTYLWTQYIIFNQFSTYLFLISLVHTIPIVITNLAIGYSILSMRIDLEASRFYFC